jgi:hypothetical protein
MWISAILAWLLNKTTTEPERTSQPQSLAIPHPEEAVDYSITMSSYDIAAVFDKWMLDYRVPPENRDHWRNAIEIEVTSALEPPAATWDNHSTGKRHLAVKPEYLNPGVLAHEQAHNSYALLTAQQKREFSAAYTPLKTTDPLITYLYSINGYGKTSDIEGHAELYRYLCEKMPAVLKKYYPKLIP